MASNPSLSFRDWLLFEMDKRRESTTPRTEWVSEAVVLRMQLEDADEWDAPHIDPESIDLHPDTEDRFATRVADGGQPK